MQTNKRWILTGLGLAVACLMPLAAAHAADAPAAVSTGDPTAVLKAVPADATAFVAIRSLKELDQDIQDSAKALGLPPNTIPSMLDWAKGSLKLGDGFNESGSMALVVLSLAEVKSPDELQNRIAVFVPATDAEALAKSMGGEKEGDFYKLEVGGNPTVAAAREGFVVIGPSEDAVKAAVQAKGDGLMKALPADRRKMFAQQDLFVWANFRGVSKELRDTLKEELTKAMSSGGMPGALMAMQEGNFAQLAKIMEEGQELGVAASLDAKRGLTASFFMIMRPETDLGKQVAAMKPSTGSLLVGLPDEPVIFAMGSVASPDTEKQLQQALDQLLTEDTVGDTIPKEKLDSLKSGAVKLLGTVEQMSIGVSGLPAEGGEGMIGATFVAKVKDSEQWKAEARKFFATVKDVAVEAAKKEGEAEDAVKQVADAVQWKQDAEKVEGAAVDQLAVDISKLPDTDPDTVDEVKKVIGKEGVLVRVASVGKNHVAITFGGGAKRFATIAGLAGKSDAPLAKNADLKKVADRIPAGPKLMEGYFNLDQLLAVIMNISNEVGAGIPIPLMMKNAAPIAFTAVKLGETGQQVEVLIPMELMKSTADLVRPFLMMGMGGGPGGDEEPAPPPGSDGELN